MNPTDAIEPPTPLGHEIVGAGPLPIVVLNDWLCDTSTWDGARPYLDGERFTWAFADLRGYGRTRNRRGAFTAAEAAGDVIALADAKGWNGFAIVGHSMSTLVALHVAQHHADRITHAIVVTPPPPGGFGATDAMLEGARALARGDDVARAASIRARSGQRLSSGWVRYKTTRWRETSEPAAVSAYVAMYARDGLPDPAARVRCPLLAITGEQDMEPMRCAAVTQALTPMCDRLTVLPLADCGHYPMQEMPPLFVAYLERFLS
jgi:pimeloyl-ACP methyl ester carboxylesterase